MQTNNPTAMSAVVGEQILLAGASSRRAELLKGLTMPALLAVFAGYLIVGMVTMRVPDGTSFPGPRFFPGIIAGGMLLFALLLTLSAVRASRALPAARLSTGAGDPDRFDLLVTEHEDGDAVTPRRSVGIDWRSLAWVVLSFLGFALLLPYLGWIIASALLFWCVSRGFGSHKPLASLVVGLTVSSMVYIAFDMVLGMSLPSGVLGWGF